MNARWMWRELRYRLGGWFEPAMFAVALFAAIQILCHAMGIVIRLWFS